MQQALTMIRDRSTAQAREHTNQAFRAHTNSRLLSGGKGAASVFKGRGFLVALTLGALASVTALTPVSAFAQDSNVGRQVEQLRKDLDLLQRYVYREGVPEGSAASGGGSSTPAAARQQVQINDLERTATQLTGQIEQFDFRIRKIEDRLDRLVSDVDYRLSQIEKGAGAPLAATSNGGNADQNGASNANAAGAAGGAGSGETLNDRGSQLFGVIENEGQPPQIPQGASGGNSAPTETAATGTPEEQYRNAFGLLRRQEFGEAQRALAAFVKNHPKDPLAGNAQYWLGETYYVRGEYENAAIAFTEGFQTYPDSSKAPDNLLKLGMSLANLGKTEDACTTFGHLIDNFPDASGVVLDRARQERKNRGCS
ncbi:tol-pal system protein YbgF [Thalassospira lucentensis]|uniref:tol-pal system protein YbgF n=1 Tax=Thalassospira lucentensis TaxID=168935 RepID=UPI00142D4A9D|nr:tol-pal system protein YbgF [Thalassospira lucentensis]NIZ03615.1 tol-pal system protein YbgF [Thalassospira lucentensis]